MEHVTVGTTNTRYRIGAMLLRLARAAVIVLAAMSQTSLAASKTFTYTYTDAQGSVIATADVDGRILERFEYKPYGAQAAGAPLRGPGYTGHTHDDEVGLVYMRARYYDPLVGRFLSPDPAGIKPGSPVSFNRFVYANGNPLTLIDPDGREAACVSANRPCIPKDADMSKVMAVGELVVPGVDVAICAAQGCDGAGWAMAAASVVPAGKVAKAIGKISKVLPGIPGKGAAAGELAQLKKQLANESQVSQLMSGAGDATHGASATRSLNQADALVNKYGGEPSDWQKVTSWTFQGVDDAHSEVHAYRNILTGEVVEAKTIVDPRAATKMTDPNQ